MSQMNPQQAGLPVLEIPLDSFNRSEKFQIRLALSEEAVRRYLKMYELGTQPPLPPIDVGDVNGVLVLVDGFHRVRALELLGRHTVSATIRPIVSLEEAQYQGAAVNDRKGVPLNFKERQRLFKAWIRAGHHYLPGRPHDRRWLNMKSYREIAAEFAVAHTTAARMVEKASPALAQEMNKRGMSQQERENIGAKKGPKLSAKLSPEELVLRGLQDARAAYPGVSDPITRGSLIQKSEEVTSAMRSNTTSFTVVDF